MASVNEIENQIADLFQKEGIGKCTERFLNTTKSISKTEEEYKSELIKRLKQGGVILASE